MHNFSLSTRRLYRGGVLVACLLDVERLHFQLHEVVKETLIRTQYRRPLSPGKMKEAARGTHLRRRLRANE